VPRRPPKPSAEDLSRPVRKPGQRCRCCADPHIAGGILGWAETRAAAPESTIALNAFYERWVVLNPTPPSFSSVRGHVIRCLGRNPVTAKPLS
jgi:hypothetical protein